MWSWTCHFLIFFYGIDHQWDSQRRVAHCTDSIVPCIWHKQKDTYERTQTNRYTAKLPGHRLDRWHCCGIGTTSIHKEDTYALWATSSGNSRYPCGWFSFQLQVMFNNHQPQDDRTRNQTQLHDANLPYDYISRHGNNTHKIYTGGRLIQFDPRISYATAGHLQAYGTVRD